MAASAWRKYEAFPERFGDNTIDLDGDTFKLALFLSTSDAATVTYATNDNLADLTNQHANANGYTTGGVALTVTWTVSAGTTTFDYTNSAQWTASGGSITARFGVIYDDTTTAPADALACYSLLDTFPQDVTATDGNTLTIDANASGVFTVTGMTT